LTVILVLRRVGLVMTNISYSGYRFPPEIIQQAIWLYVRFTLSFRDVEDLLAERGIFECGFKSGKIFAALGETLKWLSASAVFLVLHEGKTQAEAA
jgi:hypothetical protein